MKKETITRKQICAIFSISPKTAQKILNRFYIKQNYKKKDERKYITTIYKKEFFNYLIKNIKKLKS